MRPGVGLAAAALCLGALVPGPVHAAEAPPDTAFHQFLGTLSDSTDRYFGLSAAPLDTLGLEAEEPYEGRKRFSIGGLPTFSFSRVDGSTFGAEVRIEGPRRLGRLHAGASYAVSSETWLGGGSYKLRRRLGGARWTLEAWGGRKLAAMNRDYEEPFLDAARALVDGSDRTHYLRHDGWEIGLERGNDTWRAGVGYRDRLESPLETQATWNLLDHDLVITENLPAQFGRAREAELAAGARLPMVPFRIEANYWSSGPALASDFAYDRLRLAVGGDLTIARWASLVPQFAWGFLHGDRTPQSSYYLGAGPTLVTIPRDQLGGASFGMAKLELVSAGDMLKAVRIPHPQALFLQGGLFVATGAVGGQDPYGGPARSGDTWPDQREWLSEAGISIYYNPGMFGTIVRMSEGWPLGPTDRKERFEFVLTHPLDLLRQEEEED